MNLCSIPPYAVPAPLLHRASNIGQHGRCSVRRSQRLARGKELFGIRPSNGGFYLPNPTARGCCALFVLLELSGSYYKAVVLHYLNPMCIVSDFFAILFFPIWPRTMFRTLDRQKSELYELLRAVFYR